MDVSVDQLLPLVDGTLLCGEPSSRIRGFASLKEAGAGDLTFYYDSRYLKQFKTTAATAALVPADAGDLPETVACIGVKDPSRAFEIVVETYGIQPIPFRPGIHPTAVIGSDVEVNPDKVSIGPNATVADRALIADGVTIGAGSYVGEDVRIGPDCVIFPNVSILTACVLGARVTIHANTVVGSDGFGYAFEAGRHRKIRQAGIVQIDDDVEIGSGTTIDRARFGRTWIGQGSKIDNLVQIGHNVVIGKHCIIVAQTGIAGSSTLEDYVVAAAQVGIGGHVTIGARATLGARSGVVKDLPGDETYLGYPTVPIAQEQRTRAQVRRLGQLIDRVRELETQVKEMKKKLPG